MPTQRPLFPDASKCACEYPIDKPYGGLRPRSEWLQRRLMLELGNRDYFMRPVVAWCTEGKEHDMIHVLIADDHRLVRDGFRAVLEREKDLQVVGEARDGREAIELTQRLKPDIVIMDIQMPRLNGLEATREIRADGSRKVLIVSMLRDETLVRQAIDHGAQGYITKDESFTELINAIRAIHGGKKYFSRSISEILGKLN